MKIFMWWLIMIPILNWGTEDQNVKKFKDNLENAESLNTVSNSRNIGSCKRLCFPCGFARAFMVSFLLLGLERGTETALIS